MTRIGLVVVALSAGCTLDSPFEEGGVAPVFDTGEPEGDEGDAPAPGDDGDPVEDPSEYEGPADTDDAEPWDGVAAAAALQPAIDVLRTWNASPVQPAYSRAMRSASADCPGNTATSGDDTWIARCETGAGASFDGYAEIDVYTERSESGIRWTGTFWYLAAVIRTADGYTLGGGGSARIQSGTGTDGRYSYDAWSSFMQGSIVWDGPGSDESWIAAPPTPNLSMQARHYPETGQRLLTVTGSVPLEEGWLTALSFDDVRITLNGNSGCEAEPSGTVDLRDPAGAWYTLSFDGDADCDGCGQVTRDGERVDELCVDWSPLTDWSSAPW